MRKRPWTQLVVYYKPGHENEAATTLAAEAVRRRFKHFKHFSLMDAVPHRAVIVKRNGISVRAVLEYQIKIDAWFYRLDMLGCP